MAGLVCYLNGAFLLHAEARVSVDDRSFLFADGIYEVTKALGSAEGPHLFTEDRHMRRLARGLRELRLPTHDAAGEDIVKTVIPRVARELIARNGLCAAEGADATVYVQITRGAAPRAHAFPKPAVSPCVYVVAKAAKVFPREMLEGGAACVLHPDHRWARCDIKTVSLLPNTIANTAARDADCYEAVLLRPARGELPRGGDLPAGSASLTWPADTVLAGFADEQLLLVEASHSNVFAVRRADGAGASAEGGLELLTHPLDNVLPGISREVVLERAAGLELEGGGRLAAVREAPISLSDVLAGRVTELFTTSTGPNVMPIVTLRLPLPQTEEEAAAGAPLRYRDIAIGDGKVGPVGRALLAGFSHWMVEERAAAKSS